MKREIIILFSISFLAIPLFWYGNYMTPPPSSPSGNGNPAIAIMLILLILFVTMVYHWIKIFNKHPMKPSLSILGIIIISVHLIVSFLYQRNSLLDYKEVIAHAYEVRFGYID